MDITLNILLQKPPAGIDYGIQKGSGNNYESIQVQRSDGGDMRFSFVVGLKSDDGKINNPRFAGPFVQGKPAEQFFYIDMGAYAGQTNGEWNGRIKVPLHVIGWDMVDQLIDKKDAALSTTIPATAKKGGPVFATVKDFKGWTMEMR